MHFHHLIKSFSLLLLLNLAALYYCNENKLLPTVFIAILVRNKEHTLPYFFGAIERLDYPKDRLAIWIYSDNNIDRSPELLQKWAAAQVGYHSLEVNIEPGNLKETGVFDWTTERFSHLINLREKALSEARQRWADYIWFLDSDAFITNPKTLSALIEQSKPVIAPMLESVGAYSNYWCGMDDKGFYLRTDEYRPILERSKTGCFPVPMVHSATLVDLRDSRASSQLTFNSSLLPASVNYTGPFDDIIIFAHSANYSGVGMHVLNTLYFGYILMPMEPANSLEDDRQQLTNLKVEVMAEDFPMPVSPLLQDFIQMPEPDTLGFDQVLPPPHSLAALSL